MGCLEKTEKKTDISYLKDGYIVGTTIKIASFGWMIDVSGLRCNLLDRTEYRVPIMENISYFLNNNTFADYRAVFSHLSCLRAEIFRS